MMEYWTRNNNDYLTDNHIKVFMDTLTKLIYEYPDVDIKIVGDYYTYDIKNSADKLSLEERMESYKKQPVAMYNITYKYILINNTIATMIESKNNYLLNRKNKLNMNKRTGCLLVPYVIENIVTHEFGHALAEQYNINSNKEMINLFNNNSKDRIVTEIGYNAINDINEFIADGFLESRFENARNLGKEVGKLINKIVCKNVGKKE